MSYLSFLSNLFPDVLKAIREIQEMSLVQKDDHLEFILRLRLHHDQTSNVLLSGLIELLTEQNKKES